MHRADALCGECIMIGSYRDELGLLVGAICDGTIADDECERLNSLLKKNEEARQFYNNYMFLHAELYSQHASLEAVEHEAEVELRIANCGLERGGSSATRRSVSERSSQATAVNRK